MIVAINNKNAAHAASNSTQTIQNGQSNFWVQREALFEAIEKRTKELQEIAKANGY